MRKSALVLLAAMAASPSSAQATGYLFTLTSPESTIEYSGFIITDGAIGVLSQSDILSFSFTAFSESFAGIPFTSNDSSFSLVGNDLVATGRDLTFAYGDNDGGIFSFQSKLFPPGSLFLCNATAGQSACAQGISLFELPPAEASSTLTDTVTLASVPEPSTWAMMALGFAWLGLAGWRKRQGQTA
jgi:hypothetical protein